METGKHVRLNDGRVVQIRTDHRDGSYTVYSIDDEESFVVDVDKIEEEVEYEHTPTLTNMSSFNINVLFIIAELGEPSGAEILERIKHISDVDANHGRLYPNLDQLSDQGYIVKGSRSRRTNYYTLTDKAINEMNSHVSWQQSKLDSLE